MELTSFIAAGINIAGFITASLAHFATQIFSQLRSAVAAQAISCRTKPLEQSACEQNAQTVTWYKQGILGKCSSKNDSTKLRV